MWIMPRKRMHCQRPHHSQLDLMMYSDYKFLQYLNWILRYKIFNYVKNYLSNLFIFFYAKLDIYLSNFQVQLCWIIFNKLQFSMNLVDNFKLRTLIQEAITSLKFLEHVKVQDDISSQLAGFQISKLLKNQEVNEERYAQLVKKRANLTLITEKKELEQVEAEIASLSVTLKESTKKLCKLFKENPDLERDSIKVSRQRRTLITKLDELIQLVKNNSTGKFQTFISFELDSQDQTRRLTEKEKNLNIQIKKLQKEKQDENKEYQKQIAENQIRIQEQKQTLMDKQQKTELQISYSEKSSKAELSNNKRIYELSQKALRSQIANLKMSVETQTLVHKELDQYLTKKKDQIKKKSAQVTQKTQTLKQKLESQIQNINQQIQKVSDELIDYKRRYQEEELGKIKREQQQRNKIFDKQKKEEQMIRLDNAIKFIQNEYLAWKEAGGGKKKKVKKAAKK